MTVNDLLIEKKYVKTSFGKIAYMESGSNAKPTVLLVHGIPTSSFLWRHVLALLQKEFHCLAPDLMGLGDTEVDADSDIFHMNAQSEMLIEFMATLGHKTFSVICHDQGGAAVQIIAARHPEKITCLVITDCVCYDNWPVPIIKKLQSQSRKMPNLMNILTIIGFVRWRETKTRFSNFRQGVYNPKQVSNEAICEYIRPMTSSSVGRKRFNKFLLAGSPHYTTQILPGLKKFNKPTIIIWAADDKLISPSWGKKLSDDIPGVCQFELISFCGHFWQEEKPSEFTSIISDFLKKHSIPK
jgi:pimeloyl-ACP methyl ester carboxylesterase